MSAAALRRREVLAALAAFAVSGCAPQRASTRGMRVVVAGAGIVGAAIAWELAEAGADVTIIDRTGPATQTSRGTFAWINATWAKQPRDYHALSQLSMREWKRVAQSLGLSVRWNGSLEWFDNDARQARLVAQIAEQADWGENARIVPAADLAAIEPMVDFGGADFAALSGNDGAVDPVAATNAMLAAAARAGATLLHPCELTGVALAGDRLRAAVTTRGELAADRLVLATGAAPQMAQRIAGIDVPQRSTPGVIVITEPLPPQLNGIVVAPGVHLHQRDDGRVVLGEQAGPPDTAAHEARLRDRPAAFPADELAQQHAARILATATGYVPSLVQAVAEEVHIGWRPLPLDGHPVLGFSPTRPDIYLAIMHSGVTLAPLAGRFAAREIADGAAQARLATYRPDRRFSRVRRY